MNKATFSLNYRKPKSEYLDSDELFICIRKYDSSCGYKKANIKQISSGIKCKISDWNPKWHKRADRFPISDIVRLP